MEKRLGETEIKYLAEVAVNSLAVKEWRETYKPAEMRQNIPKDTNVPLAAGQERAIHLAC